MSTRSTIALVLKDGSVKSIYCHFDGNLKWVGKTLFEHYNTYDKVIELIKLGSLSSLGIIIKIDDTTHSFDNRLKDVTVAYHRDRDEDLVINEFYSIDDYFKRNQNEDYNYLFDSNSIWTVSVLDKNEYILLSTGLDNSKY